MLSAQTVDIPSGQVTARARAVRHARLGGAVERHLIGVEITHMEEGDRYRFVGYPHPLR